MYISRYNVHIVLLTAQFGSWELGPQHGFARISQWQLLQEPTKVTNSCNYHYLIIVTIKNDNGSVSAVFRLSDNEDTRKMWNCK